MPTASSPRSCGRTGRPACWWCWPTRSGTPCRPGWASMRCRPGSRRATPRSCWRRWPTAMRVSRSPTSRRTRRRASRSAPTSATGPCRRSSRSRTRSGVEPGDSGAHGNAFDRVSAFQDGYDGSATTCSTMTITNRTFTQRAFGSRADAARRGNLPVDRLLDSVGADAPPAFARFTAAAGLAGWQPPRCAPPRAGAPSPRRARRRGARRTTRWWSTAPPSLSWRRSSAISRAPRSSPAATASPRCRRYGSSPPVRARSAWRAPTPAASSARTARSPSPPAISTRPSRSCWPRIGRARDTAGTIDPRQHGYERIGLFRKGVLGGPRACL